MASREKFPNWRVDRSERRKPKRTCAPEKLGADGMREYKILKCAHSCGAELAVLADNFYQHKNQTIVDHLAVCPSVPEGERPAKIPRGGVSMKTLADPAKTALIPSIHKKCHEQISELRDEMESMRETLSGRIKSLELYRDCLANKLQSEWPSIALPFTPDNAIPSIKLLIHEHAIARPIPHEHDALKIENTQLRNALQEVARERDHLKRMLRESDNASKARRAESVAYNELKASKETLKQARKFCQVVCTEYSILAKKHGEEPRLGIGDFDLMLRTFHAMAPGSPRS